jgi:hypothetical protein
VYPGGIVVTGSVVDLKPVEQIRFTYGYETQNRELVPPGGSLVTVTLEPHEDGTLLRLKHDLPSPAARDAHIQGWRYQLALFANAVTREQHQGAEPLVDRYLALWAEPDRERRRVELTELGTANMCFQDSFGLTSSPAELADHIGAAQMHMPGMRLERDGALRQCQGTGLVNWVARSPDGSVAARGSNVFEFAPDGRLARVVGLWGG